MRYSYVFCIIQVSKHCQSGIYHRYFFYFACRKSISSLFESYSRWKRKNHFWHEFLALKDFFFLVHPHCTYMEAYIAIYAARAAYKMNKKLLSEWLVHSKWRHNRCKPEVNALVCESATFSVGKHWLQTAINKFGCDICVNSAHGRPPCAQCFFF